MQNKFRTLFLCLPLSLAGFFAACDSNTNPNPPNEGTPTTQTTDATLYELAKATAGFTWYKKSDGLLKKSAGSGHTQPLLRTRYNAAAATKLDGSGKVVAGASFPDGALIVKELVDSANALSLYAILYKKTGDANADAKGWVWGYINPDGSVRISATQKGSACISCHSQTGSIDYMLMNKFFP